MDAFAYIIDIFLHLDRHLAEIIRDYDGWTYLILFLIVFAETGLVVTPFLPGDSLLFTAGVFAGLGDLNLAAAGLTLSAAAVLGDTVNYGVGKYLGNWLLNRPGTPWIKRKHIDRTHSFFERYGGKTIVLARFVPIVRTFAPFVAGIGAMTYVRFLAYNVVGGVLWVAVCVGGGYAFGGLPIVKNNFSLVVLGIVVVSIMPAVVEYVRHRRAGGAAPDLSRQP